MKAKDYVITALLIISILCSVLSLSKVYIVEGPQGVQGVQGEQGLPGIKGDKGETGERGLTGEKGDRGEPGAAGLKGDKGDTGAPGPQGVQGATGATGAQGEQGIQGPKGDKGDTGSQGEKGEQGSNGITPHIGENGNWYIGDVDTEVLAEGQIYVTSDYFTWKKETKEFVLENYALGYSNGNRSDRGWNFLKIITGDWKDYVQLGGELTTYSSRYQGDIRLNKNTVRNITSIVLKYSPDKLPTNYSSTDANFYTDGEFVYEKVTDIDNFAIKLFRYSNSNIADLSAISVSITADFWTLIY